MVLEPTIRASTATKSESTTTNSYILLYCWKFGINNAWECLEYSRAMIHISIKSKHIEYEIGLTKKIYIWSWSFRVSGKEMIQYTNGFLLRIKTVRDLLLNVGVAIDNEELLCIIFKRLAQRACPTWTLNAWNRWNITGIRFQWDWLGWDNPTRSNISIIEIATTRPNFFKTT